MHPVKGCRRPVRECIQEPSRRANNERQLGQGVNTVEQIMAGSLLRRERQERQGQDAEYATAKEIQEAQAQQGHRCGVPEWCEPSGHQQGSDQERDARLRAEKALSGQVGKIMD